MRYILAILLLLHGLIHLMGNARCWGWARVPQLTGRSLWAMGWLPDWAQGLAWGLAAVLMIAAAMLFLFDNAMWWLPGAVGLILSQLLVVAYWPEARWGTLANLLLLVPVLSGAAEAGMEAATQEQVHSLMAQAPTETSKPISEKELESLPGCIQRWLQACGVVGHSRIGAIYMIQKGRMRTSADGGWMSYEARQVTTTQQPGFVWNARVRMLPGVQLFGRDAYTRGHGHMYISLLGLAAVANAKGKEIDQGSQLRYLAEMAFYPTEVLQPYLRWQALEPNRARVHMVYEGVTCHADFIFNDKNELTEILGPRYYEQDGHYQLMPWQVRLLGSQQVEGLRVPSRATLTWKLPEGDFTWAEMDFEGIRYNDTDEKMLLFLH